VNPSLESQLDFDTLSMIVAAHARTGMGRALLSGAEPFPPLERSRHLARLTLEMATLLDETGPLPLAGVDDAVPWLDPAAPPPREPRDLLSLLTLARRIAAVRRQLLAAPVELGLLREIAAELPDTAPLVAWAAPRLGRDGRVPDEASPELARLRQKVTRLRQQLMVELETIRRGHSDVATDAPPTLRRDRYCLPVRASSRGQLPGLVLDSSGSGATVFLEPFAVVEVNNDLADTTAQAGEEAQRILDEVAGAFTAERERLAAAVDRLAELDTAQARALFGQRLDGRVVDPGCGTELVLCGARHPLLDERLQPLRRELIGEGERRGPGHGVVPLSLRLPDGVRTVVISGPNAGGKTVVLKTVGLLVLMARNGIPLPAEEGTAVPPFDHLWCHIGDEQDVTADLSTFSAAMASTANLLRAGDGRSLVLYDELGAGTDPLEGAALGCALLEELTRRGCLTLASTHLAAIALAASSNAGMDNAAMGFDEGSGQPTYSVTMGRPGRSRGLDIARSMGLPPPVLERARELLGGQHLELDRWLERLEHQERELRQERLALATERARTEALGQVHERALCDLEEEGRRLTERLGEERERLRRVARSRLDEALARLDEATRDREPLGRRQRQRLREEALSLPEPAAPPAPDEPAELGPGTAVLLPRVGEGVVSEIRGDRVLVVVAGKRLWVGAAELAPSRATATGRTARVEVGTADEAPQEVQLLGLDTESAREDLERFLDRALASGRSRVRVVHGHGTGALRRMVREICSSHPAVRSFRHPPQHMGGTGVTEVTLEGTDDGRA